MSSFEARIPEALAEIVATMASSPAVDDALAVIARAAQRCVPGFDGASVTAVRPDGKNETPVATGPLVRSLDELQYELDEGPCVMAARGEPLVVVERLGYDARWSRYVPRAAAAGLRSQVAVPLSSREGLLGALNLYSTTSDTVDPAAAGVAQLFAAQAALALARARREERLNEILESRTLIGTAIGIVMVQQDLTERQAFAYLARLSSTRNRKLRDIASQIVWDTDARNDGSGSGSV